MKKVLLISSVELKKMNSSGQRVFSIAQGLKKAGVSVEILGYLDNQEENINGFKCSNICMRPKNKIKKYLYYFFKEKIFIKRLIVRQLDNYDKIMVCWPHSFLFVTYKKDKNYANKIMFDVCEKNSINSLSLNPISILSFLSMSIFYMLIKKYNVKTVCISNYLYEVCSNKNNAIIVPFFYHKSIYSNSNIPKRRIVYFGNPGKKDDIYSVVKAFDAYLTSCEDPKYSLLLLGCNPKRMSHKVTKILKKDSEKITAMEYVEYDKCMKVVSESAFSVLWRNPRLTTNKAGFPSKVVQSFSVGTPVITNNTSDLKLYLNEDNSFFSNQYSVNKLTSFFIRINSLQDSTLTKMRKSAISSFQNFFSIDRWYSILGDFTK